MSLLDGDSEWGASLDNLHIRPEFRGQGIGRLFAETVRWVIREDPKRRIYLWVFEANDPARRFYEKFRGKVIENRVRDMPGGVKVSYLRMIWQDTGLLLRHLRAA